jgi:Flp pilus assembly protein TadD
MCRMTAAAATVLALLLVQPSLAASKTKTAKAPVATAPVVTGPTKASPQQRAEASRMEPLARAAFWSNETQIDPRDAEAGLGLAQALRALGRYEEAAAAAEGVVTIYPDNLDARLEVARAHLERGQGFYAIESLNKAMQLAPKDWRPVSMMAIAFEQTQRDAEALASHKQALALAPNEPGALTNLAMYQAGHGDLASADALLRQAAALPTASAQVRQNLAMVLGLEGRFDEAESLVRRDLPPEQANANLAMLRAAVLPNGAPVSGRSWDAMRAQ